MGSRSTEQAGVQPYVPPLSLLAAAFWFAWYALLYTGKVSLVVLDETNLPVGNAYIVGTAALCLVLFFVGFFADRLAPYFSRPPLVIAVGVAASLSTVLVVLGWFYAGAILASVFTALLATRFSVLFGRVAPKTALIGVLCGFLIASFVDGYILSLDAAWSAAVLCALPLLGATGSLFDPQPSGEHPTVAPVPGDFKRLVGALFLLTAAVHVARGAYPALGSLDMFSDVLGGGSLALSLVVRAVLLAAAVLLPARVKVAHLVLGLFAACVVLALPLVAGVVSPTVAPVLFATINTLRNLVFWAALAALCHDCGHAPLRVFGWGFGCMALGSVVGVGVGHVVWTSGLGDAASLTVCGVLFVAILVGVATLVPPEVLRRLFNPGDPSHPLVLGGEGTCGQVGEPLAGSAAEDGAPEPHGPGRWRRSMQRLADEHGISPREADVLELLLKGNAKQNVAEELGVSYNTVRAHVRSIYAKCDVHSQQELLDLHRVYLEGER